jgi:hypothetical protein
MKLDADEKELLDSVERGEWKSAKGAKRERVRYSRWLLDLEPSLGRRASERPMRSVGSGHGEGAQGRHRTPRTAGSLSGTRS